MIHLKKNYKLTQDFIHKIFEQSAGYVSPETFDLFIRMFESEISHRYFSFNSESNLLRIILGIYDKSAFLNECIKFPNYIEILVSIALNSNYLTDILVRNPEYFYWIINPSTLNEILEYEKFSIQIKNSISVFKSFSAKVNSLRILKRKEMLRIGVKDIMGISNLKEITNELSILANVITAELFSICYTEILVKYSLSSLENKYCLISLGKLGGNELNYSSDIDLIIFFDEDKTLPNKKFYSEILTEAIYLFIESASSISSSGYLYRVDFRLRPDGRNSPLCRTLPEYLNYYESHGEDWERQMLIKMNFCLGSYSLYKAFESYINSFVYPLSFSTPPVEQINKMKDNIEKNLTDEENIKLIPGGIRDIEFSVQALQLLNGGRNTSIKTPNTLEATDKLFDAGLLSKIEYTLLKEAYIFYRRIEHFLQLMNDSQTHTIPAEGEILEKLSAFLSFKNPSEFKHFVFERRKAVKKVYYSIMGLKSETTKMLESTLEINFKNRSKAVSNLQFLREGKGLLGHKQFDKSCTESFVKLENVLMEYLRTSTIPDNVLQNFVRIIRNASLPSVWYKEFENTKFFLIFLQICEFSQMSIELFAEDQDLREHFLTRKVFEKINNKSLTAFNVRKILFTTAVQFTLGLLSSSKVSITLKKYFIHIIHGLAEKELPAKIKRTGYLIAAMGSFGTGELTFTSDIDLIFAVKNLTLTPDVQKYFQILLQKLKEKLKPFEVDCRLRPEGKNSNIIWDIEGYKYYITHRARTWELQAFTKLDFISGNINIFSNINSLIKNRISRIPYNNIKYDIHEMRSKLYPQLSSIHVKSFNIKKSKGGLLDIEFIIQYLILSNKGLFSKYRGKRVDVILTRLIKHDENLSSLQILKDNFIFLKEFEMTIQNIFSSSSGSVTLTDEKLFSISKRMEFKSTKEFNEKLSSVIKLNHSAFIKYLEG